jgi:hypothetical protein
MNTKNTTSGFNLLSFRGRKFLTLIVASLVLALTAGALISDQSIFSTGGLTIALPGGASTGQPGDSFSPLVRHLASITHRTVTVSEPLEPADLYVHSLAEFLTARPRLGLVPLRALSSTGSARDAAVLFTAGDESISIDQLSPSEVVFTAFDDPNGFWAQLAWLRERGFRTPSKPGDFQFEGAGEHAIRVVYSVVWGRYKIGACRMSDLTYLLDRGLLHSSEVQIITETAALPELILSSRPEDSGRWVDWLSDLTAVLNPAGPGPSLFLAPIDEKVLRRAGRLADDRAADS